MKIVLPVRLQDFDTYYQLRWEILRKPGANPKEVKFSPMINPAFTP